MKRQMLEDEVSNTADEGGRVVKCTCGGSEHLIQDANAIHCPVLATSAAVLMSGR